MKKIILGLAVLVAVVSLGAAFTRTSNAVLSVAWTCKLAQNADGTGSAENWGNLRKPIYFNETQNKYIIEREGDTLMLNNSGYPWLPWKFVQCVKQ